MRTVLPFRENTDTGAGSKALGHKIFVHLTTCRHKVNDVVPWVLAAILLKLFVRVTKTSIFLFPCDTLFHVDIILNLSLAVTVFTCVLDRTSLEVKVFASQESIVMGRYEAESSTLCLYLAVEFLVSL